MNIKQLGGILLITGNAIGGGMLAVPLATAQAGFLNSSLFLIACWGIMLAGGLLILEVNLWFPPNSHLISMASYKKVIFSFLYSLQPSYLYLS